MLRAMAAEKCPVCKKQRALHALGAWRRCAPCWRNTHEMMRTPITIGGVLKGVVQILGPAGAPAALIAFVICLPWVVLHYVGFPEQARGLYDSIFLALADGAAYALALQAIVVGETDARAALRQGLRAWWRVFITYFFGSVRVFLFVLLLIVPGIVKALSIVLGAPIAVLEGSSGSDALDESERRMKGHRLVALVVFLIAMIPPASTITLDLVLPPQSSPIPDLVLSALSPVMSIPALLVTAVLYAKTFIQSLPEESP